MYTGKTHLKIPGKLIVQRECKSIPVYENLLNVPPLVLVINRDLPRNIYLETLRGTEGLILMFSGTFTQDTE